MSNQVIEKHNSSVGKKVNVKQIWLYCAEGKSEEKSLSISDIGTDNSQNIWQLANNVLFEWAITAPTRGYNKIDFKVMWLDGQIYEGTYSLKRKDAMSANLGEHIHSFLMFHLEKPSHLSEENYQEIMEYTLADNPSFVSDCQKMLEIYDIWR